MIPAISRIAELGLRTEATILIDAWARENRADDAARLRATWVAFRWGLPEMQARQGWFLQNRLRGRQRSRSIDVSGLLMTSKENLSDFFPVSL